MYYPTGLQPLHLGTVGNITPKMDGFQVSKMWQIAHDAMLVIILAV